MNSKTEMAVTASLEQKTRRAATRRNEPSIGVAYWIDLITHDRRSVKTTSLQQFRSGEHIRLVLKTNHDAYLRVANLGATGASRTLFPDNGASSWIKAHQEIAIPESGYIKLDENSGVETLKVMLSPYPFSEHLQTPPNGEQAAPCALAGLSSNRGTDDWVWKDDSQSARSWPAHPAVTPALATGKIVAFEIKLKHTP
jgi:hypothetical protein